MKGNDEKIEFIPYSFVENVSLENKENHCLSLLEKKRLLQKEFLEKNERTLLERKSSSL